MTDFSPAQLGEEGQRLYGDYILKRGIDVHHQKLNALLALAYEAGREFGYARLYHPNDEQVRRTIEKWKDEGRAEGAREALQQSLDWLGSEVELRRLRANAQKSPLGGRVRADIELDCLEMTFRHIEARLKELET